MDIQILSILALIVAIAIGFFRNVNTGLFGISFAFFISYSSINPAMMFFFPSVNFLLRAIKNASCGLIIFYHRRLQIYRLFFAGSADELLIEYGYKTDDSY